MDLPGIMSRGNWTAALFVDDKALGQAVKGLTRIFTGRVGGTTHLLSILVGQFLGVHQMPISYETQGDTRIITHRKICRRRHHAGARQGRRANVVIRNSEYWIGPDVIVAARRQVALPRLRAQLESRRHARPKSSSSIGAIVGRLSAEIVSRLHRPYFHRMRRGAGALALFWRPAAIGRRCSSASGWRCWSTASTGRWRAPSRSRTCCRAGRATRSIWSSTSSPMCSCRPCDRRQRPYAGGAGHSVPAHRRVTGAIYFADRGMKTGDNYFRGFPAVWNLAAFYLYLLATAGMARLRRRRRARGVDLPAGQVPAPLARRALALAQCRAARGLGGAGADRGDHRLAAGADRHCAAAASLLSISSSPALLAGKPEQEFENARPSCRRRQPGYRRRDRAARRAQTATTWR